MKKHEALPCCGKSVIRGKGRQSFPFLPSSVFPGSEPERYNDHPPHTVFLPEKENTTGWGLLEKCISEKTSFVVLGRGWPKKIPTSLLERAKNERVRIIGPRSDGLLLPFASEKERSNMAILAEGGDVFTRTIYGVQHRGIHPRYAISFGEGCDYSPFEAASTILETDKETDFFVFILAFLRKGRDLLDFAARAAAAGKKTALLRLTGDAQRNRVEEAALAQYGIFTFYEPFQVVDAATAFLLSPQSERIRLHREIERETMLMLRREAKRSGLKVIEEDPCSLVVDLLSEAENISHIKKKIEKYRRRKENFLFTASYGDAALEEKARLLSIPFIPGIRRCMEAVSLLLSPVALLSENGGKDSSSPRCPLHPHPTEYDAKILLGCYGIPIARERLCQSLQETTEAAEAIGYPVALKVMSPSILHKTEARVIALNLQDGEELRNAYGRTLEKARLADPKAKIRGVLVQEMIRSGTEWRMEFRRDERFGPLVEVGISGVYTEILPDGVIRVAPFDEREAFKMICESRGYPLLLEGWRRDRLDIDAFVSVLVAFSRLAFCEEEVSRLDINPLFVNRKGVLVVDAFIERKGRKK